MGRLARIWASGMVLLAATTVAEAQLPLSRAERAVADAALHVDDAGLDGLLGAIVPGARFRPFPPGPDQAVGVGGLANDPGAFVASIERSGGLSRAFEAAADQAGQNPPSGALRFLVFETGADRDRHLVCLRGGGNFGVSDAERAARPVGSLKQALGGSGNHVCNASGGALAEQVIAKGIGAVFGNCQIVRAVGERFAVSVKLDRTCDRIGDPSALFERVAEAAA